VDADRSLVEEAAGGSREAFDELVRRYQGQIVNLARAMTNSDDQADDLAQEAFVRAWRSIGSFRSDATFRTWLYGVALNVIRTHRTRRSRWLRLFSSDTRDTSSEGSPIDRGTADDGIERPLAMRQLIDRALAALPVELSEAVVLRDVEGLEYQEIAAALGVPIGTVESRIFRGRKRLRSLLRPVKGWISR